MSILRSIVDGVAEQKGTRMFAVTIGLAMPKDLIRLHSAKVFSRTYALLGLSQPIACGNVSWRACRYKLPIVVLVMNNNGIYGGDRRQQELKAAAQRGADAAGFGSDPVPTAFVSDSRSAVVLAETLTYSSRLTLRSTNVKIDGSWLRFCLGVPCIGSYIRSLRIQQEHLMYSALPP